MIDKDILIKCLAVVNTLRAISFIASNMVCLIFSGDNTNVFIVETAFSCIGNIGILFFLIIDDNPKDEVQDEC